MTGPKILVVEDDPVFRRVIGFALQDGGFQVHAVSTGNAALALLAEQTFDGMISDHQMPGICGIELLAAVRSLPTGKSLPIILCTAKGFELDSAWLRQEFHLAAILHKPFSPQRLVQQLREVCLATSPA
jgi:CheY-like chemotaxis protein